MGNFRKLSTRCEAPPVTPPVRPSLERVTGGQSGPAREQDRARTMTAFTARRRAEEFDSLVEGTSTGRDDARYADFLDIVAQLRSAPEPVARPEFVGDLRERLMVAAATELAPADDDARLTLPARRPARERRIAIAVGALALVGATTSVAMAAQSALPGEALYPVKRAIENAQTGFSTDEADKGSRLLANASGRLDEVTELSAQGDLADNVAIASTLNTFTEQTTAASDLLLADYDATGNEASIDELRTFTADSMDHADQARGDGPRRGARRADPRRPGARPDRRGRRSGSARPAPAASPTCLRCSSPEARSASRVTAPRRAPAAAGQRRPVRQGRRQAGRPRAPRDRRVTAPGQRAVTRPRRTAARPVAAGRRPPSRATRSAS